MEFKDKLLLTIVALITIGMFAFFVAASTSNFDMIKATNITATGNITLVENLTFTQTNRGSCHGDACNGSVYWNGSDLIIQVN